ncbi:proline racemase family protein [Sphaerisporangium sp. NPDC051011]|uniref:proline racemase family protein n=1 Tax=Sphaerisporangium sp. NPDC051011 TaxID=3155792 RepID=UPI003411D90B
MGPEFEAAIETVDHHTGGEPFRVVTAGAPDIPGRTVLERRTRAACLAEPVGGAVAAGPGLALFTSVGMAWEDLVVADAVHAAWTGR